MTQQEKEEQIIQILLEEANKLYPAGRKGFFCWAPGMPEKIKLPIAVFIQRAAKRLSRLPDLKEEDGI